jgi:hypothetical protein
MLKGLSDEMDWLLLTLMDISWSELWFPFFQAHPFFTHIFFGKCGAKSERFRQPLDLFTPLLTSKNGPKKYWYN